MEPLIDLEHVNVARGEAIVLHDINLPIGAGECLAILGPNGCGKSTLLKTITCELYPLATPGTRVSILGRERWDLTELHRRMGVVGAELPGKPMLRTNALDAILTGFFSSSTLWPNLEVTPSMRHRAEEILTLVGAETLRHKLVGEMSAGQQRRIMIGRALAGTSLDGGIPMLLLDEPSNALDIAAQRDLRALLRTLAQQGTAILLITHHVADILPEMHRIILMREGRITADGSKPSLLTSERLSNLFGGNIVLEQHNEWWSAR